MASPGSRLWNSGFRALEPMVSGFGTDGFTEINSLAPLYI